MAATLPKASAQADQGVQGGEAHALQQAGTRREQQKGVKRLWPRPRRREEGGSGQEPGSTTSLLPAGATSWSAVRCIVHLVSFVTYKKEQLPS